MPELPDVVVYVERLMARFGGQRVEAVRVKSPFVVRSFEPPLSAAVGRTLTGAFRIGKRIALVLEPELYLVFHLMIAGRFHLAQRSAALGKIALLALDFPNETLLLTEASTKKRASRCMWSPRAPKRSRSAVAVSSRWRRRLRDFDGALRCENHTLKRALTDPRLFSGIGNAYSDEILHRAPSCRR